MGTIAAPLLGGFSIAMVGVVAQASDRFRWPGFSLTFLALAAAGFIVCIQCGFWARQYLVRPDEVAAWYQYQADPAGDVLRRLAANQLKLVELYFGWVERTKSSYRFALVSLIAGFGSVLPPTGEGPGSEQASWRWLAACIAAALLIFELFWIIGGRLYNTARSKWPRLARVLRFWFVPVRPFVEVPAREDEGSGIS